MKSRRYRIEETVKERFIRMPYALFANPQYKPLTPKAKILYALLLDRMTLSIKHGWKNENSEVYLIYPRETIADLLGMQPKTVSSAFRELHDAGLIEEERPGCGRSNRIYVLHAEMAADDAEKFSNDMDSDNESDSDKELEKYERYMQMCKNDTHCTPKTPDNEVYSPPSEPKPMSLLPIQRGNNDVSRKVKMTPEKSQNDLRETSKLPTIHTDLNQTDDIQTERVPLKNNLLSQNAESENHYFDAIRNAFQISCPSLKAPVSVKQWSDKRKQLILNKHLSVAGFKSVCVQAEASDFLTGRTSGKDGTTFSASFDWLLKNWESVAEGSYDNRHVLQSAHPSFDLDTYEQESMKFFCKPIEEKA